MNVRTKMSFLLQTLRMLKHGYSPTRWSANGIDITYLDRAWNCNGSGSFEKPEDAAMTASAVESELWRFVYVNEIRLRVSSQGRITDEKGNDIATYKQGSSGHLYILLEIITGQKRRMKRVNVHKLVGQAFCLIDPTLKEPTLHHLNGNRYDNRASNLVYISHREHMQLHLEQRKQEGCFESTALEDDEPLLSPSPTTHRLAIKDFKKEWHEVLGYSGLYWINQRGWIINSHNYAIRCYAGQGRWQVNLEDAEGDVRRHSVDHLIVSAWCKQESEAEKMINENEGTVLHKNGDQMDNDLSNLKWIPLPD